MKLFILSVVLAVVTQIMCQPWERSQWRKDQTRMSPSGRLMKRNLELERRSFCHGRKLMIILRYGFGDAYGDVLKACLSETSIRGLMDFLKRLDDQDVQAMLKNFNSEELAQFMTKFGYSEFAELLQRFYSSDLMDILLKLHAQDLDDFFKGAGKQDLDDIFVRLNRDGYIELLTRLSELPKYKDDFKYLHALDVYQLLQLLDQTYSYYW